MDHYEKCHANAARRRSLRGGGRHVAVVFGGTAVLLPADGVRVLLRPLLLRQERALLLAAGTGDTDPIGLIRLEFCTG